MIKFFLLLLISFYQYAISPLFPKSCRHQTSCSTYMYNSIAQYGVFIGGYFGIARLLTCSLWHNPKNSLKHGI